MKKFKIFGLISLLSVVLAVFFDAVSDATRNNDNFLINWHTSEVLNMLFYFSAICFYIAKELVIQERFTFRSYALTCAIMLLEFAFMRFVLFDYIHNYFFNVNIFYVGNTSFIDQLYLKYIANFFPPSFLLMLRLFIFIVLIVRITSFNVKLKS